MITPAYALTATERVLPRLALDWTTGVAQSGVDVARTGVATFVGSNGLIQSASANTQRIDYSTGTAGLLVEEARTNRVLNSSAFGSASWLRRASDIAQTATGPDGVVNSASTLTATANNANFAQRLAVASSACVTSLYVKRRTGTGQVFLSQSEPTGSTFAVNGDFSSATNWTPTSGWVIDTVAGTATYTAESANRSLSNTTVAAVTTGTTYVLQYTVVANTLNAGLFRVGGFSGASVVGTIINLDQTVGTHRFAFVSEAAGAKNVIDFWATSAATSGSLTISNVSLFEVVETAVTVTAGWTRVALTSATILEPNVLIKLETSGDAIDVYGAQNEIGAFPTSYIPTEATAVTRNADVATMTGTNFSDWYNATEGTFAVKFNTSSTSSNALEVRATSGNTDFIRLSRSNTTGYVRIFSGGSEQAGMLPSYGGSWSTSVTVVGAYKINSFASSVGGVSISTDASGAVPVNVTNAFLGTSVNGGYLNGHLQSLRFWPQRLTNAEVQAFSK
jgi:hypothetical protein